jgi:hypothetical protein
MRPSPNHYGIGIGIAIGIGIFTIAFDRRIATSPADVLPGTATNALLLLRYEPR